MRSPVLPIGSSMQYQLETILRAERAMRCSPFNFRLFQKMQGDSVALHAIAGSLGVQHHYTRSLLSELAAESHLVWLIQVGLLRREVDGQGLTDCFRLTPLGRLVVDQWQDAHPVYNPRDQDQWVALHWKDYALNFMSRWLRIR